MIEINKHEQIRKGFADRGEKISEWADREGFQHSDVYAVLSGRIKGVHGKAHKIAVKLGLKKDPNKSSDIERGGNR